MMSWNHVLATTCLTMMSTFSAFAVKYVDREPACLILTGIATVFGFLGTYLLQRKDER